MLFTPKQVSLVDASSALPGRAEEMPVLAKHEVLGTPLKGPFPDGIETAIFGLGCFWGAERIFSELPGVYTTMRQGNDVGTQYRSAIYWSDEAQRAAAEASGDMYSAQLKASGYGEITTEIAKAGPFYYAEDYHQQYLHKNLLGSLSGDCLFGPIPVAA
jgi:peptide-methionine (S)-S-oxide reductase